MVKYVKVGVGTLAILFIISLGVNIDNYVNDEGIVIDEGYILYDCEKETIEPMYCYKLSKVGTTGVNRNCYYDRERSRKYKVCSTGWERIEVLPDDIVCPEQDCSEITCQDNEVGCPYVYPCPPKVVCEEPKECPSCGGGGSSSCPTQEPCPTCNEDGTTICTEIIGFMSIPNAGTYYCRNCGIGGCDECILNDDIMMDFDMTPYD